MRSRLCPLPLHHPLHSQMCISDPWFISRPHTVPLLPEVLAKQSCLSPLGDGIIPLAHPAISLHGPWYGPYGFFQKALKPVSQHHHPPTARVQAGDDTHCGGQNGLPKMPVTPSLEPLLTRDLKRGRLAWVIQVRLIESHLPVYAESLLWLDGRGEMGFLLGLRVTAPRLLFLGKHVVKISSLPKPPS